MNVEREEGSREGWSLASRRAFGAFVLSLVATVTGACAAAPRTSAARDGAVQDDATSGAEVGSNAEIGSNGQCTIPVLPGSPAWSDAVTGSVRGSRVDAVVGGNGMQSIFLGPDGSGSSTFTQSFSAPPSNGTQPNAFVFHTPSDVLSASLTGWAGTPVAEVGTYATMGCGGFVFEMRFPIPAGVVCPSQFGNCGPDCESQGELANCTPAHPKTRYRAVPGAPCVSSASSPIGDWQLALTSVCPREPSGTFDNFETHGHLTATLINEADATDSVVLNLDF